MKEKLEAEWELVKFMGQEENTELREKLELLEEDITDQQVVPIDESLTFIRFIIIRISTIFYGQSQRSNNVEEFKCLLLMYELYSLSKLFYFVFVKQIRKKNADEKLQLLNKLLVGIKSGLEIITQKLYAGIQQYGS